MCDGTLFVGASLLIHISYYRDNWKYTCLCYLMQKYFLISGKRKPRFEHK
jgi:hypothetical protein